MSLLKPSSGRPLSSPRRVLMLICALGFWFFDIGLIYNHQLAVERLPDTPPAVTPDGVVLQSTDYSCGPACLATLFGHYNIVRSERECAALAGTNLALGTRLAGLKHAGHSLGFEAVELDASFPQLEFICHPAIVFNSDKYHLVTFWGMDPYGRAIIRDPALGRTTWGPEEYEANTPASPALLVFFPGRIQRCDPESPSTEIARYQHILRSLGWFDGACDGRWTDRLTNAVRSFQSAMSIEQTGVIDAPTSIYLEGAWRVVSYGVITPFMAIDRADTTVRRMIPVNTRTDSTK